MGNEGKWDTIFRALKQFKQREFGYPCKVSGKHIEHLNGGVKLKGWAWVKVQRYQQGCGKLDDKGEKRLERVWAHHMEEQRTGTL